MATFGLMLVVNLPHLADPLVRWDDFPALLGDEAEFFEKTLSEGRWLNYWWIARPFLWPPWVNFLIYLAGWSVFASASAFAVLGPQGGLPRLALLSALIAVSPQAFLISAWFNTLVPGVWFLALFGILAASVPVRALPWLFLALAPVSMLFYSTYPFILIALCALRYDAPTGWRPLLMHLGALCVGLILGIALMNTLNYLQFGIFGVEMDESRLMARPDTLADAIAHAQEMVPLLLRWLFQATGFGMPWLSALMVSAFAVAAIFLARTRPGVAVTAIALIGAYLAIVTVHAMREGNLVPMRSLIAVWLVMAITLFAAAPQVSTARRWQVNIALALIVALYGGQILRHAAMFQPWQAESRRLAAMIPTGTEQVYLWGDFKLVSGAKQADILHADGLSKRLELLTGAKVNTCGPVDECAVEPPILTGLEVDHLVLHRHTEAFIVLVEPGKIGD